MEEGELLKPRLYYCCYFFVVTAQLNYFRQIFIDIYEYILIVSNNTASNRGNSEDDWYTVGRMCTAYTTLWVEHVLYTPHCG